MGNLLDVMRLGGTSLGAQQVAAQVVGNNISNANSPGFHRQDVTFIGQRGLGGIRDTQVQRAANALLEGQMQQQQGAAGFAQKRALGMELVVNSVGEMGPLGINAGLSNLFAGLRDLSISPNDLSVRSATVSSAKAVAQRINTAAQDLSQAQIAADNSMVAELAEINANLQAVAELNGAIAQSRGTNEQPWALMDKRDAAMTALAAGAGATSCTEPDGTLTVFIADISVVSQIAFHPLSASENAATGLHDLSVDGTSHRSVQAEIDGGALGGYIAARDGDIAVAIAALDAIAFDLATAFNTAHAAGYDLDGNTGVDFFHAPTVEAGCATTLSVSNALLATPRAIAAASTAAAVPGDNTVALRLTDLERANVTTSNTQTLATAVGSLVSSSGQALALSRTSQEQAEGLLAKTQTLFESQAGVSVDEQMLQLSRIQNAYQASAKLVETANRMLETLQNM